MENKKSNKKGNTHGKERRKGKGNSKTKSAKSDKSETRTRTKNNKTENNFIKNAPLDKPETFNKINGLFRKFQTYPVITKREDMLNAKKELVKAYKTGSTNIQQSILYICHNFLFELDDIRQPQSTGIIKRREQIKDDAKLRISTYQKMFNYNTSFEGIHEVINLLALLDDAPSAKILTHLFSHTLTIEVEGYRMLRNDVLGALKEMTNKYAIKALIYYHSVSASEYLSDRIAQALKIWRQKLDKPGKSKSGISKQERERIIKEIDATIGKPKETSRSQYR